MDGWITSDMKLFQSWLLPTLQLTVNKKATIGRDFCNHCSDCDDYASVVPLPFLATFSGIAVFQSRVSTTLVVMVIMA